VSVEEVTEILSFPSEEIPEDAKRDGVTKRLKIPSWDDIMFGGKKDSDSTESE